MSITIVGGGNPSGPTYPLQRSVRLRSSASAYFNRTPAGAGNRKTWTWSGWVKRGILNSSGAVAYPLFAVPTGGTDSTWFEMRFISDFLYVAGFSTNWRITSQVFRDPSAWYHIVLAVDTTQATANDRLKLYVNGVQVTAFSTTNNPTQNTDLGVNQAAVTYIGFSNTQYFDGYLTEVNFVDGQALTPTSFGAYNSYGVWSPAKYTGAYGTNGFYLNFQDNSAATAAAIGKDSSGNGNNWTPNNISVTAGVTYDSMLDVPTLTNANNANFCTLNPLDKNTSASLTISNGNLTSSTTANNIGVRGTIGVSSGKWYWEHTLTTAGGVTIVGIANAAWNLLYVGSTAYSYGYSSDAFKYNNGGNTVYGATYTTGDVIGVAFDADAATLVFYKNNVSQGTAFSSIPVGVYFPAVSGQINGVVNSNFGQRPFTYTPPTGFKSLNTYNLPAPTIPNGATQFAATLATGNNSTQSIVNTVNGVSFQPDFVWLKIRSTAENHIAYDSVRGVQQYLSPNLTLVESTLPTGLTSFNSNGFTLGSSNPNYSGSPTFVGWQWKANGTPAVTNTSGSIPSTISANTTAGFSIVTYTGTGANATVGHGLGVAPKMVIVKGRNSVNNWTIYHAGLTSASFCIFLDLTNAQLNNATVWQATAPTSSVFSVGTSGAVNNNTTNFVAYCFSEIAGYSKFGSYTGNGSADGPFIYTGFRPRWLLLKNTGGVASWYCLDSSRNTYNVVNSVLVPNSSQAEVAITSVDFLSNGFKLRTTTTDINGSGTTYIYAAFAESPFNYSLAR